MTSWLDDLINQHSEWESPRSFWQWAGLITISAIVKDNVWLHRGSRRFKMYPNIYVILHADSGLKKGPPIALASDLVREVNNTRIISGRASIQAILKKMGTAYTIPGGKVINKANAFICSSELSASLVNDPAALTLLTDLYDRQYRSGDWESLLKQEEFKLKDPIVQLFGGINHAHAKSFFDLKDLMGGFYARTFIVYEKEEQTINSLVKWMKNPPDIAKLSIYLKELSKLNGPFKDLADENTNQMTEAGEYYDTWYNEFKKSIKSSEVKDETGTLNRFGDSVLKVAMLLSLSKSSNLEIDIESMMEAVKICEILVGNVRKTTFGTNGMSTSTPLKGLIIHELLNRETHQVTRMVLMNKYWMHWTNSAEFDEMMLSFENTGMIKTSSIGNNILYTMPPEQVILMQDYMRGKNK